MKRNWKRILSLWLTVCMVFTMNFGLGATVVLADTLVANYSAEAYDAEKQTIKIKAEDTTKATTKSEIILASEAPNDEDAGESVTLAENGEGTASVGEVTLTISQKYYAQTLKIFAREGSQSGYTDSTVEVTIPAKAFDKNAFAVGYADGGFTLTNKFQQESSGAIDFLVLDSEDPAPANKTEFEGKKDAGNNTTVNAVDGKDNTPPTWNISGLRGDADRTLKLYALNGSTVVTVEGEYTLKKKSPEGTPTVTAMLDGAAITVKRAGTTGTVHVIASTNPINDDAGRNSAFDGAEGAGKYNAEKVFKLDALKDETKTAIINSGVEKQDEEYSIYVYARTAAGTGTLSSNWVEATGSPIKMEALKPTTAGNWNFTYGNETTAVKENLATYKDNAITFVAGTEAPKNAVLGATTGAANGLKVGIANTTDTVTVSLNGIDTPKTIEIGDLNSGSTLNIVSHNNASRIIKESSGTKSVLHASDTATKGDKYTVAEEDSNVNASSIIKDFGTKFSAQSGYEIIPDTVITSAGVNGEYALDSTDKARVYALSKDKLASIIVSENGAQQDISSHLNKAALITPNAPTVKTDYVSFNVAKNLIPAGTYKGYLVSNNIADAFPTTITAVADTDTKIEFKGLPDNQTFTKFIISSNGAAKGNIYTLGVYHEVEFTGGEVATTAKAPVLSDFNITKTPESITVSSNKSNLKAILVSGNNTERKLYESGYGTNANNYEAIDATPKKLNAVVSSNTETPKQSVKPSTAYYLYAGYTNGGNTFISELAELGPITTLDQPTIDPVLSVKDFTYKGAGVAIADEITAVSSPSAKNGAVEIYALKTDELTGSKTADELFEAAKNQEGNWTKIDAATKRYKGSEHGWVSGNYTVVAKYVRETDDDDTYKAGKAVSDNFTINRKDLWIQPKLVDFSSISINTALGDKFVPGTTFTYQIVDEDNKLYSDASCDKYAFTVDGKVISASTSFNTAGVKAVYVSANSPLKMTKDDAGSYNLRSKERFATFTVIKLGELILSTTGRKFYYEAYVSLNKAAQADQKDIITKYVDASMSGVDMTDFAEITYIYRKTDGSLTYSQEVPNSLSVNDYLYISANYAPGNGSKGIYANEYVALQIESQPVVIVGKEEVKSARFSDPVETYKKSQKVEVLYQTDEVDDNGEYKWDTVKGVTFSTLNDVVKADATIDISSIDTTVAGTHENLTLTLDTASMNTAKFSNYHFENAYLEKYTVTPAISVTVKSAATGATISENVITVNGDAFSTKTISVSVDSLPTSWEIAIGNGYETVLKEDYITGTLNADGKYVTLDLSGYLGSDLYDVNRDLLIYAVYKAKNPETENANASGMYWELENPTVFYNGGKYVATGEDAKKGVNNKLKLTVKNGNTGQKLVFKTDYKLSYKNNQKVGNAGDSKGPQIIVQGLGSYKNMKFTVPFTILPESFENAQISVKKQYVQVSGKKVKLGETVKVGSTKVGNKFYQLIFKDPNNNNALLTEADILSVTTAKEINVYVKSVNTTNKVQSFSIGDTSTDFATVWVYPKGGKKMKVKLTGSAKGKYSKATTKTLAPTTILKKGEIEITADKNSVIDLEKGLNKANSIFYTDKNLTDPADVDDNGALMNAGTYYLAVVPNTDTMKAYSIFEPAVVKITYAGTKLTKKDINLAKVKLPYTGEAQQLTLVTSKKKADFEVLVYDQFSNEYVISDSSLTTSSSPAGWNFTYNDGRRYVGNDSTNNNEPKYLEIGDYDKGAGKFKITVVGTGDYEGKVSLQYSYEKGSIKSEKLEASMAAQYYNAAGYDKSKIKLTKDSKDVTSNYSIDDVTWTTNGTGDKAGKGTITFKNYKGTLNVTFKVNPIPIDDDSIKVVTPSVLAKNASKHQVYLTQSYDKKTVKLKAGKDYVISKPEAKDANRMSVIISVPEKGSGLTGGPIQRTYYIYDEEVKNIKITALSANKGYISSGFATSYGPYKKGAETRDIKVSGNGTYYQYEGTKKAVLPQVMEVTCTKGGLKDQVIPSDYYDVTFTPAYATVKDGDKTVKQLITGKYTVTITINEKGGQYYPSYTGASATYEVNQASN